MTMHRPGTPGTDSVNPRSETAALVPAGRVV